MPPLNKKSLLPFLHVLKSLKARDRIIILAHLDDETRDSIYKTISQVLRSNKVPIQNKLYLRDKLKSHKDNLRYLINQKKSSTQKKKKLTQIGGSPLSVLLNTALPLMLNLFPA